MSTINEVDQDKQAGAERLRQQAASDRQATILVAYLIVVAAALMYLLVRLWPEVDASGTWGKQVVVFWRSTPIPDVPDDMRLLLLVIAAGGLGSFIHAATSLVDYVGNKKFVPSWGLWYLMRPLIGSALALVLYVAARGGLLSPTAGGENVSPFGVAALAFLAGMFSKQATDKLSEVFTTLFKTKEGDAARKDKLDAGPKVVSVEPAELRAAGGAIDLTVNGSGFESTSIVRLNGQPRQTTFVDASKLVVKVPASDLASAGTLSLVVDNASGPDSEPVTVTVV